MWPCGGRNRSECYDFIYFLGICQIVGVGVFESTDVVESVVADAVTVFYHHPVFVRVFLYIVAYHEEGSFNIVFFQQFQYPGSNFGDSPSSKVR